MSSGHVLTGWRERRRSRRDAAPRALSIRAVVEAWAILFGVPALVVIAALVITATLLTNAIGDVIRDTASMAVSDEIELHLLGHHRLSALELGDPALGAVREEIATTTDALLDRARQLAASEHERALIAEIDAHTTAYRDARAAAEARGVPEPQLRREVQPLLERALGAAEELRALNEASVARAQRESLRIDRLSTIAGVAAAVLLLASSIGVALGARRYVIRPLEGVHATLARFRAGDASARVEPSGSRELREIAVTLNDHIVTTARQREARLNFIAGVAHDLRNPLAALRMSIDLSKADSGEATRARVLATVDRQVARLGRMVDDLLDATRIEAGQLVLHRERLDLRQTARETMRLYEASAPGHELALTLPEEPVIVDADPLRVEQVANNLVSNAVKYSPGGGRVDVVVSQAGGEAILEVRDEGIGIAPEAIAELFAPYRRLSTEVAPGVGLGLSVVKRIVQAHGGRVEVESVLGRGSTFRVRLPLASILEPERDHRGSARTDTAT